ncbi:MAG: tryptophan--tRNA ligase [Bdellovibrionales bacterium]|nr:tryptophan--tRNA ligase [Bdellovibrionales bacterium]
MAITTVLTGVKPTGQPHIGNYLGAIRPALELSSEPNTETWLFIADYHTLTTTPDPKRLREMTYEVAATWLACGLDPNKTVFYRQSDIPEILELSWILSCFTPKGLMNRAHAYKAKVQENQEAGKEDLDFGVNMGLYSYPVLMAADILVFSAHKVPVGEDQVQHLEIARDIAQKFNRQYGEIMKVPQAVVPKVGKNVPGLDGRKMSKSYDNSILMFEEPARLKKLVGRIKTDSLPPEAPKSTDGSIIFDIYQAFAIPDQIATLKSKFEAGISWGAAKEELFQVMDEALRGPREKYKQLMADKSYIDGLLKQGAERARANAVPFMHKVRQAIGVGS